MSLAEDQNQSAALSSKTHQIRIHQIGLTLRILKKLNPISFRISRLRVSFPELKQIPDLKIFSDFQSPIKLTKPLKSREPKKKTLNSITDPFEDLGFNFPNF
jgi:hypothetical protein